MFLPMTKAFCVVQRKFQNKSDWQPSCFWKGKTRECFSRVQYKNSSDWTSYNTNPSGISVDTCTVVYAPGKVVVHSRDSLTIVSLVHSPKRCSVGFRKRRVRMPSHITLKRKFLPGAVSGHKEDSAWALGPTSHSYNDLCALVPTEDAAEKQRPKSHNNNDWCALVPTEDAVEK